MRESLYNSLITRVAVPIALRANVTVTGNTIDRTDPAGGSDSTTVALIVVFTGTITDGSHAAAVQDSDDGSSWTAVAAEYLQGTVPTITATDDNAVFEIGYMGPRRYLRVNVTGTGATTGGTFGAVVLLGGAGHNPVQR